MADPTERRVGWQRSLATLAALIVVLAVIYLVQGGAGSDRNSDKKSTRSSGSTTSQVTTDGTDPDSGLRLVAETDLPAEARTTLGLIQQGGPFPYPGRDGAVFENRERILPSHPRGYYHEYTVKTPGSGDRGARRIIAGGEGEYYYTADHYASFVRVELAP